MKRHNLGYALFCDVNLSAFGNLCLTIVNSEKKKQFFFRENVRNEILKTCCSDVYSSMDDL